VEPVKEAYFFCTGRWHAILSRVRVESGFLFLCWWWRARGKRNGCKVSKVEPGDEVFTPSSGDLNGGFVSEQMSRKHEKLTN
jgi:hypothetical protein